MRTATQRQKLPASARRRLAVWPIRTEADYERALAVVDKLAVKGEGNLTETERDRLDIFTALVEAHDERRDIFGDAKLAPGDVLRFLLDQHGMTASDLGRLLGARTLGSKLLRGEREPSKTHIKTLCRHFSLPADVFFSV